MLIKNISKDSISFTTGSGTKILKQNDIMELSRDDYSNNYKYIASLKAASKVVVMDYIDELSRVESIANLALSIARS